MAACIEDRNYNWLDEFIVMVSLFKPDATRTYARNAMQCCGY